MKDKFFRFLLLATALVVAGVAAYFSVFGISKLFAGAMMAAIVMASSLELGKLILSSYVYRAWNSISKLRRAYGVLAVGVLMLITSVGIYGFLSNAFESTSIEVEQMDSKIEIMDTKISSKESEIDRYQKLITDKQSRIVTLTELRKSQEVRLDSLLANEHWVNSRRTAESIENADIEISGLYTEIDELNIKVDTSNNQLIRLKTDKLEYKGESNISGEVGPLKYIARLTGSTMDKVVNWVILLLIFVFDPLAIYLILSYNHLVMQSQKETDESVDNVEEGQETVVKGTYQPTVDNTEEPTNKPTIHQRTTQLDSSIKERLANRYSELTKKKVDEEPVNEDNEVEDQLGKKVTINKTKRGGP